MVVAIDCYGARLLNNPTLRGWDFCLANCAGAHRSWVFAVRAANYVVKKSDTLQKARLGEMLLERELLEAKIAALEARDPGPLARRRSRR
jgi:hypothetical protein